MRALQIESVRRAPVMGELSMPSPGPGEVLVRISACGLNFADLLMIDGRYQDMPEPPFTLGMELAGVVEALGPGTEGPRPGSRVAVLAGHGGLAEYGAFPASRCLPIPDTMSFEEAAGFQIAYGTSHIALGRRADLRPGETLLVLGAGGGVGLTAVEIGALMGATVIACARGRAKLEAATTCGAHHVIDSEAEDIREKVTALGGADVVFDAVGGDQFRAALRTTNPEGRILAIGFASGDVPQIPANHLLVKNVSVIGLYWGGYLTFAPEVLGDSLKTLLDWYAKGRLRPQVGHVLPFDRSVEALDLIRSRRATGKVVVSIPG